MFASSGRLAMWRTACATRLDVDGWFGCDLAAGLEHAFLHPGGHLGAGVADVDLPASDVVLSSVQSRGFGEPGDRVLRCRVRCGIWPG